MGRIEMWVGTLRGRACVAGACLLVAAAAEARTGGATAAARPPSATAARTTERMRIDGTLQEAAWQRATPIGGFFQREPREGEAATEETEVRVLLDENTLYFGILCRDRTPSGIISTLLTRDADPSVDDYVLVIVDPFYDQRTGFFFTVNPAGARGDGQVANSSQYMTRDWDGIWEAAARITDAGWVAEIAIPFKTLRFKPGQTTWGLNVERYIKRREETDRWAAPRRDIWITNLAEAGRLDGLDGIRQGKGIDIRPYASAGEQNHERMLEAGLDVIKNLTPNLNASLTINTDFGETEADIRQVNLTRFPLYFPEKRSFFLEGAGIFDIAGVGGSTQKDVVPFFSRRIGLLDGEQIPILAGAKVIGRQGNYQVGFLDVQTRDTDGHPNAGQNLFSARVIRNLFRQSTIGVIATRGNPTGSSANVVVGADAKYATSAFRGRSNLSVEGFFLRSDDSAVGSDYSGGFRVDYPNDLWDISLNWKHIGEHFTPALGFVPRAGIRKLLTGATWSPRPHRWGVRQISVGGTAEVITNLDNVVQNWRLTTTLPRVRTDAGDGVAFTYTPEFERLDTPFEISPGVRVSPGSYQWGMAGVKVNTATKRRWVADVEWRWGSFYDGTQRQMKTGITVKPSVHVFLSARVELTRVELPAGDFYRRLFTTRADYNFSPNVSWANLIQYENESRILGIQSRFRWIVKPGTDVFLVFNRGWYRDLDATYLPSFDRGSVKFQYTFRL
jgi:hypothetical protein